MPKKDSNDTWIQIHKTTDKFTKNQIFKVIHFKNKLVHLHELKSVEKIPYLNGSDWYRYKIKWQTNFKTMYYDEIPGDLDIRYPGLIYNAAVESNGLYQVTERTLTKCPRTGKLMAI